MPAHTGLERTRQSLQLALTQTSRHVDIMSPQLVSELFDNDAICEQLTRLARRGRFTRIRILVHEIKPLIESGHKLVALAGRLKTAIEIRVLEYHPEWRDETLIVLDRSEGLLLKARDNHSRMISTRPEAKRLSEHFDRIWQASHETLEFRHLS